MLTDDQCSRSSLLSYFPFVPRESSHQVRAGLANIAATFANGGVCPVTQKVVMQQEHALHCLQIMFNCGLYVLAMHACNATQCQVRPTSSHTVVQVRLVRPLLLRGRHTRQGTTPHITCYCFCPHFLYVRRHAPTRPIQSGVSGALFLSIPGELGIAIWSPPLDRHGNSVRGLALAAKLVEKIPELHIFGAAMKQIEVMLCCCETLL